MGNGINDRVFKVAAKKLIAHKAVICPQFFFFAKAWKDVIWR